MERSNNILSYFGAALVGSVITLVVFQTTVISSHTENTRSVVATLSKNLSESKHTGAMSVIESCQSNGFVFLPNREQDAEKGTFVSCNNIDVVSMDKSEFAEITAGHKEFSSKKSEK